MHKEGGCMHPIPVAVLAARYVPHARSSLLHIADGRLVICDLRQASTFPQPEIWMGAYPDEWK